MGFLKTTVHSSKETSHKIYVHHHFLFKYCLLLRSCLCFQSLCWIHYRWVLTVADFPGGEESFLPDTRGSYTIMPIPSLDQGFLPLALVTFGARQFLVMGVSSEHRRIFSNIPGLSPLVPFLPSYNNQWHPPGAKSLQIEKHWLRSSFCVESMKAFLEDAH